MSDSQDNLLDYKEREVQGEDLLNQSADSGSDYVEDEVIELEEDQQEDPGLKLGCDEDDIFNDGITDFQLERATNAPTQEENPEGPDQSPEVVELPPPVPMEGIESEQDSAPLRDGHDIVGLEDPSLSPQSVEDIPLGQEDSR